MSKKITVGMLKKIIKDADPEARILILPAFNLEISKLVNIKYDKKEKELCIIYDVLWK